MSRCGHCGARGAGTHCTYCGTPLVPSWSGGGASPKRGGAQRAVAVLVFAGLVLGGLVLVGSLIVVLAWPRSSPPDPSPAPTFAPRLRGPACPIGDVDGDGIGDYAAMVQVRQIERLRVGRITGVAGQVLDVEGPPAFYTSADIQPFCPGSETYGVLVRRTRTVELFDGTMLQPRHRIPVPFEPRFVGSGPGCLSVLDVRRQRHLGVDLSTGEGGRCEAPFRAPGRGITGHSLSFQSGRERRYELCERGVCYTVEADSEGQQTLTARRGGSELWTIAVRHDRPHALALISADPVLVVLGRGVREGRVFPSSRVIALGIDPTTGREVWARAVGHSPVTLLHANGRFVVIAQGPPRQSGGLMTAIEPATGEVAWTLGGS